MPGDGKQVVQEYYERLNRHDLAGAAELLSDDCAVTVADSLLDRNGYLDLFRSWLAGFPDLGNTVEEVVADGDTVAVRSIWEGTHDGGFAGIPPTGRRVRYGSFSFSRVEDGRITQRHLLANLFGVPFGIAASLDQVLRSVIHFVFIGFQLRFDFFEPVA